jgi:glycosyltransferase involved in cell wall biosynthesis
LKALDAHADVQVDVFAMQQAADRHQATLRNHRVHVAPVNNAGAVQRVALERSWFVREQRRMSLDLMHHLGGTVPAGGNTPVSVTIHDLQPLDDPLNFSPIKRRWLARSIPTAVQSASLICTPSDWVADSIHARFGVPYDRLRTVSAHALANDGPTPSPSVRVQQLIDRGPVLLYPAMTLAHKNHRTLFRAFSVAAKSRPDAQLVCVGAVGRDHDMLTSVAQSLSDRIHLLGHVPAADLHALMAAAEVMVFPSNYEGFGLPVLEAQQMGLPVVCSNATALPEVAGTGAVLLGPEDIDAWIDVMSIPMSTDQRIELIRAGAANCARYSAERMANAQIDAWSTVS